MLFYSLNDGENDSGDELLEMEEDCSTTLTHAMDLSVTDGIRNVAGTDTAIGDGMITVDVSNDAIAATSSQGANVQTSPSAISLMGSNANLLAYKTSDLTLEDLRVLYVLTQFDDKLTVYSAEVPSCWNDLGQVQKQRKQSQNMRHGGDERDFTKTWRLHNDA